MCSLMVQWHFTRGVEEQTKAFLDGFNDVVPLQWLLYFDERELEVRDCFDWLFASVLELSLKLLLVAGIISSVMVKLRECEC